MVNLFRHWFVIFMLFGTSGKDVFPVIEETLLLFSVKEG